MSARIEALRARMAAADCDAFFSLAAPINQYLSGFTGSTSAVVVTPADAVFLCDFRYTEQAGTEVADLAVEQVAGPLAGNVGKRLSALGARRAAFEPDSLTVAQHRMTQAAFAGELVPCDDLVAALRRVKRPDEIARIRAASALAEGVLADLLGDLRPGVTESELAARFEYEFRVRGASGASFEPIALFGARSSLPHGAPGGRALQSGDIVLLDFGCRLDGYCSDLTRTYAFGTMPPPWFEEVYELVLAAQCAALEAVRPGMTCRDLDAVARDLIREAGHAERFGHGLGHGVGIEIHESPRLNPDSQTVLEPGMVVTIEPGVYLPERGGVRIEDLIVVTENGCDILSSTPKDIKVIAA